MPLTILDPQTALIVVDLQKGLRDIPSLHPIAGVIDRSCQLYRGLSQAEAARGSRQRRGDCSGEDRGASTAPGASRRLQRTDSRIASAARRHPHHQTHLGRFCEHGPGSSTEGEEV